MGSSHFIKYIILLNLLIVISILSQNDELSTYGWSDYYNKTYNVSFKYPSRWEWYNDKNQIIIQMTGFYDDYGRSNSRSTIVTIVDAPIKSIPFFSKLERTDLSKYDCYEYISKGDQDDVKYFYLDIGGKRFIQFQLYPYSSNNLSHIQTVKMLRALINSFSID